MEKNKPGRNWRVLLTELGIIVLGVGIALAAQQAVEWWQWRQQVQEARETIASEMARNISYGTQRMLAARCLQTRLWAIQDILNEAERSGVLPPLGNVGGALVTPWSSGAWESVVASQTATHFPRRQLASLSLSYARVQRVENWNRQEAEAWSTLRLGGPGRRFEPSYGTELRKALGLALHYNNVISISSRRFIQDVRDQNLPFTPEERQRMAEATTLHPALAKFCQPISAVPVRSGSEISQDDLRQLEEAGRRQP